MPYKPVYSTLFNLSLSEIASDLAAFSPNFVSDLNSDLGQQINVLCEFPQLYPAYEYNEDLNLDKPMRKMVLVGYKFIVLYWINDKKKEIKLFDILHTSRDIKAILSSKLRQFY